ncbi:MAG: hypothetical protein CLLPBCKN_007393 [Chroococcidiopsis cubana SAG 39.79]|nr:hypothetical protein [Chroococcidiopsis cubana SAG 39.79]
MVVLRKTIMTDQRRGSHTVTRLTVHLVWVTKYRYPVLKGEIQKRCRELIIQICDAEDVQILKGVVSKDHVHMHVEYPPSKSISDLIRPLLGRTSRLLLPRISRIAKTILGEALLGNWVWGMEYGESDGGASAGVSRTSSESLESGT